MAANKRPNPLRYDFHGSIQFDLTAATHGGKSRVTLHAETIDRQAEDFFGGHQCHRLAAALHCLTGWDVVTIDRQRNGTWAATHSAVLTPDGKVLDIHGKTGLATAKERYRRFNNGGRVRHRIVDVRNMPGDVLTDIDHLRGDRFWWGAHDNVELTAAVSHFARHVLRCNGFAHLADRPNTAQ